MLKIKLALIQLLLRLEYSAYPIFKLSVILFIPYYMKDLHLPQLFLWVDFLTYSNIDHKVVAFFPYCYSRDRFISSSQYALVIDHNGLQ